MIKIDTQNADVKKPAVWLATWFGFGFLNPAPGTWGSLAALPFALAIYAYTGLYGLLIGIVVVTCVGIKTADYYNEHTGIHDSKAVVIDEVAGQWIAVAPILHLVGLSLPWVLFSFMAFRLFDITKLWPASYFDRKVKTGLGVMLDDIIAGIYAAILTTGVLLYAGIG